MALVRHSTSGCRIRLLRVAEQTNPKSDPHTLTLDARKQSSTFRTIARVSRVVGVVVAAGFCGLIHEAAAQQPGVVKAAFIFDEAPFAQCHASTLVQSGDVLVAAWFGGTREKLDNSPL